MGLELRAVLFLGAMVSCEGAWRVVVGQLGDGRGEYEVESGLGTYRACETTML
jgi:hypothetical protein